MRSWVALVKREFLEHRGAFLYAPAVIMTVIIVVLSTAILMNQPELAADAEMPGGVKFYEGAYLGTMLMWSVYLIIALLFYFSDAFHADRRGNSLLFWKSMPKSDLEILGSKVLAAYTILPLAIGVWALISGVVAYLFSIVIGLIVVFYNAPNFFQFLSSFFQVTIAAEIYIFMALIWFAPFFGWAAFLGTIFKRWSIPLFFVIPALAILLERVINIRDFDYSSKIWEFILFRLNFGGDEPQDFDPEVWIMSNESTSAWEMISYGLSNVDYMHMAIGVAILGGFVVAASEYRRRLIDA